MGVSRYTIEENLAHYDPNGQWVLYGDHEAAMAAKDAEIAALADKNLEVASLRMWVVDAEAKASRMTAERDHLVRALHDAIARPLGVVPRSAEPWYNPKLADTARQASEPDATPAPWKSPQPAPSGLRWGVRHKATGEIVGRLESADIARAYIDSGRALWMPDELEVVYIAPAPVETPAQPPASAKSH